MRQTKRFGQGALPTVLAEGAWSEPVVAGNRGATLRGRLVVLLRDVAPARREPIVCVELQDAADHVGSATRFHFDPAKLECTLRDAGGRPVLGQGIPFGGAVPLAEWIVLPSDATLRLRVTPFGIHEPGALALTSHRLYRWTIRDGDRRPYFLAGSFTAEPPPGPPQVEGPPLWHGTLSLPPARLVNPR